jgi:hypothetical protein
VPLAPSSPGDEYDDVWAGGWEELFPNDAAGRFAGRDLPDHGEWWTRAWAVAATASGEEAVVRLELRTEVVGAACVKEFRLANVGGTLSVRYRLESREPADAHVLFKQHLPIAISPACRLVLPGGTVQPVDPAFGTLLGGTGAFAWPHGNAPDGSPVDLSVIPAPSPSAREFLYVSGLPAGWCGVDDQAAGASLRLGYDARTLPFVWLFLSYGGWRSCYTAVLEPCSNMPKDLAEAVRLGQSALLPAGGSFETWATVTLGSLAEDR